jgi:TonB family protein
MLPRSWASIVLVCAGAAAQPPQVPSEAYHVGGAVNAPKIIERPEPHYSEEARVAKLEGSVLLSLVVGEDGQARDLRVRKSLGLGLDENAIATVSRWRFEPGTKEGRAVAVQTVVEVNFRLLLGAREWHLAAAAFNVPQGATQPRLLHARYPMPSGLEQAGSVRLSFDVDEQGIPMNIAVESASDPQWEDEVTALIREWRFQAALKDGLPIAAHGHFDFGRGDEVSPRVIAPQKR